MLDNVLFVTDDCDCEKEYSLRSKNSEGNKKAAKNEMIAALKKISKSVFCTYSISEANKYMIKNNDCFTVTTYYGEASADSKSIIPILCKTNNIKYWGADAYTQMMCNDKYLSKKIINQFNLNSIPGVIIYSPNDINQMKQIYSLKLPLIIKPNFGGGSNGIMNCSYVENYNDAIKLIKLLYKYQKMPILVEEYISGNEISFIIIGNKNEILFADESMLSISNKTFFENEVFGLESKKINGSLKKYIESYFIDKTTKNNMIHLFQSFDKMEFMRIDCRVDLNGKIYILELSPDCYVGSHGAFFETFSRKGYSFDDMIELLINNSINNQNY